MCDAAQLPALPMKHTDLAVSITIGQGTGSGFLMQASNSVYLVTARHVLFDPEANDAPPYTLKNSPIRCSTYLHAPDMTNTHREWSVDGTQALVLSEIRFLTNHDICLVRLEDCNPTNKIYVHWLDWVKWETPTTLNPWHELYCVRMPDVEVGADCYGAGFPTVLGLGNTSAIDFSQPLLRKGIVAGMNLQRGIIIADCPAYKGNSGGMVLTRSTGLTTTNNMLMSIVDWKIIGIQTDIIPVLTKMEVNPSMGYQSIETENSGYSVVEPIDNILDLVWK